MPQPKRSTAKRSTTKRTTAARKTTATKRASTASKPAAATKRTTTARKKPAARKPAATAPAASARAREQQAEERIRELNDQIIDSGKELGNAALDAYESALKTIATTLSRGPGKSDVEFVAEVANGLADFVREVAKTVVPAARKRLK